MTAAVAQQIGRPGLMPAYRAGTLCPVCDCGSWHVGRLSVECARCGLPLPIAREPATALVAEP